MPASRFVTVILLVGEFVGLLVFVVMYARRTDWRSSYAGRTLMAWPATLALLFLVSVAARLWPSPAMGWTLAVAHGVFFAAVWNRVRVLRRYLRHDETEGTPGEQDTQGSGRGGRGRIGGPGDRPQD